MTIFIWVLLNLLYGLPVLFMLYRRSFSHFASIMYGAGVWAFLVIGLPFVDQAITDYNWVLLYGVLLTIGSIPLWFCLFIPAYQSGAASLLIPKRDGDVFLFSTFWLFCLTGILLYLVLNGPTPFMDVIFRFDLSGGGRDEELIRLRKEATYNQSFGRVKLLFYTIPPLLALYGHILFRQGRISSLVSVISISVAVFLSVQFLHKDKLVFLLVQLLILDMFLRGWRLKKILKLGVLIFLSILVMYVFYSGGFHFDLVNNIFNRIFVIYIDIFEFVISYWPMQSEFLEGTSFPNPMSLFPYESVNLSGEVFKKLYGGNGNAPVAAIGEGYVNFGMVGAVLISVLIWLWLFFLTVTFQVARQSALIFAVWLNLAFSSHSFGNASFFSAVSIRPLFVFVVLLLIMTSIRFLASTIRERTLFLYR